MSFDMFLCAFRGGELAPFSLAVLDKFLGPFIEFRSDKCWSLSFPNGGKSFLYLDDDRKEIDNFCVNRPADSPEPWTGLLEILRETGGMLCWPGGGAVVAEEAHIAHLPPDMIKIFGTPTIVGSGREIEECISKSLPHALRVIPRGHRTEARHDGALAIGDRRLHQTKLMRSQ